MRNYVQPGRTLTIPAPADISGGSGLFVGSIFGIAAGDAVTGGNLDLTVEGIFELPKVEADEIAIGNRVYYNVAEGLATVAAGAEAAIGYAVTAAANGAATVNVRLVPTM